MTSDQVIYSFDGSVVSSLVLKRGQPVPDRPGRASNRQWTRSDRLGTCVKNPNTVRERWLTESQRALGASQRVADDSQRILENPSTGVLQYGSPDMGGTSAEPGEESVAGSRAV